MKEKYWVFYNTHVQREHLTVNELKSESAGSGVVYLILVIISGILVDTVEAQSCKKGWEI